MASFADFFHHHCVHKSSLDRDSDFRLHIQYIQYDNIINMFFKSRTTPQPEDGRYWLALV